MNVAFIVFIILLIILGIGLYLYIRNDNIIRHKDGDYEIIEYKNFLTKKECEYLIEFAKKTGMEESTVLNYDIENITKMDTNYRKSKTCWLKDSADPLTMKIATKCEKITGLPRANQEELQVLEYEENGMFNEHFDACAFESKEYCDKINRNAGQRKTTLIIYLNDNYEGGETEFTTIGIKIKPEVGKAILFWNVDEKDGILEKSKHRGNMVKNGKKWICTKWTHGKEFI